MIKVLCKCWFIKKKQLKQNEEAITLTLALIVLTVESNFTGKGQGRDYAI